MSSPAIPRQFQMFIDGERRDSLSGRTFERRNPADGSCASVYPAADAADVDQAVAAARRAFDSKSWTHWTGAERAQMLRRVAAALLAQREELALLETRESGKPIAQARDEVQWAANIWEYAGTLAINTAGESVNNLGPDDLGLVLREPAGVVALITPWNFPLLIISQKLPFALAAGCCCVVKPSEMTSGTTLLLADILAEADLPPGVVNIVTGFGDPVGARLAGHPDVDVVSFTGSTAVGRKVVEYSSGNLKKVLLELGGKNPQIVFPDADLDAAADAVVFGFLFNMGECCNSGSRLLIHESIADAFLQKVVGLVAKVKVGDPMAEDTRVGAIINETQLGKILGHIRQATIDGALLHLGGGRIGSTGYFVTPTIFDHVRADMAIAREEVFGPVLSVIRFSREEEALEIANGVSYGLSASVWTRDLNRGIRITRGIRAGTVWVNTFMDGHPQLPFGGYKQSGLGRELGPHALEDYQESKTVLVHAAGRASPWVK